MAIIIYGKISLTCGDEYLVGYEEGNPYIHDVKIIKIAGVAESGQRQGT